MLLFLDPWCIAQSGPYLSYTGFGATTTSSSWTGSVFLPLTLTNGGSSKVVLNLGVNSGMAWVSRLEHMGIL